ncbi:MAG: translation initiation factor IF-3 [Clostridia bacterium]|nr:translation initiation factor IF-3 [Clostridia bacterium]
MRGRDFLPSLFYCKKFRKVLIQFRRCFNISSKEQQINEEIRDKEIRVISNDGEQLGIMSAAEALKIAESKSLDLVKIAPAAKPPVCKIMDYGKFRFEKAKREKEARKNQKVVEIKEIRLSLNIDTHDFDTKINHARKFIGSGDKVKVSIRFRGREMAHPELGLTIMSRCAEALADCAAVEKPAKLEGRQMLMFMAPKSSK